ncbi:MAG: cysteine-rich CWC family protein [Proteobacteria bacterium]|nr:cysteine-rich CWC family protein [Pseudomonadota bacterium]
MSEAAAVPDVRCPRCGGRFHCGVHDAEPCACTAMSLSPALLARLRQDHRGCLCLGCLQALQQAEGAEGVEGTEAAAAATAAPTLEAGA